MKKNNIPPYELELMLAHILQKSREYVLAYPEIQLTKIQAARYKQFIKRRQNHEPMAYILGHKEFYGLDFKVTRNTLIPRPETELLVELAAWNIEHETWNKKNNLTVIDVGTGSGNIIISLAHNTKHITHSTDFYATDISEEALRVARYNAKKNNIEKKIKFIKGNLLEPIIKNKNCSMFHAPCSMIIVANLPYLSQKIYSQTLPNVKNYEPKSALLSGTDGLDHYKNLLEQIKLLKEKCSMLRVSCFMEISPEQKTKLEKLIINYFPASKFEFKKDLAGKWRLAIIKL